MQTPANLFFPPLAPFEKFPREDEYKSFASLFGIFFFSLHHQVEFTINFMGAPLRWLLRVILVARHNEFSSVPGSLEKR